MDYLGRVGRGSAGEDEHLQVRMEVDWMGRACSWRSAWGSARTRSRWGG